MRKICLFVMVCAMTSFALCSLASAAEGERTKFKAEEVPYKSALTVDFGRELDLPFPNLVTLGSRIEVAKGECEPITVALCALELQAAEAAAGKKASYTSEEVMEAAIFLAKRRCDIQEMVALKKLIPAESKSFDELIKLAKAAEGQESKAARCIHICYPSRTCHLIVNGYYIGTAYPNRENIFYLQCPIHADECQDVWVRVGCKIHGPIVFRRHLEAYPVLNEYEIEGI